MIFLVNNGTHLGVEVIVYVNPGKASFVQIPNRAEFVFLFSRIDPSNRTWNRINSPIAEVHKRLIVQSQKQMVSEGLSTEEGQVQPRIK